MAEEKQKKKQKQKQKSKGIKILFCILVKPGVKYREIGNIIQKHAQAHGYAVVKSFCGHGIHE